MKIVWVKAECMHGCEDPDGAAGLWEVTLNEDLSPELAAGAALDVFHRKVAISEREDFEVSTLDPGTHQEIHQAEDYQDGSGCGGDIELIGVDEAEFNTAP